MTIFEKAQKFIYRNARPLDLARWQFHFENGSTENVLKALSFYQNDDGGFAHGIEPDFLNPNSSPIGVWAATEIIRELDIKDKHPIIDGILRYLDSGADFDENQKQWLNTIPTNNDFPHAIWWEHNGDGELKYNPTASLAGFIISYAEKGSALYEKGCTIAKEAAEWFINAVPFEEPHITNCFIALYESLESSAESLVDMSLFKEKLLAQVSCNICSEREKWATEYVAKPSDFFLSRNSIFYPLNTDIADHELQYIADNQLPDGSYSVNWKWWTDYKEFEISANMWRSSIIIKNMRYLKGFDRL